ncbi:HipA N-terminal domain-containing protein [Paracoccus sp. IB05]|uniref:HipA N-terminal domain-containing protein n=1 Tax=Paracoccus sp. IB05 TaxID=2779367 RepID=UPI001E2CAC7B|nr:HipA N-terminal domain-containing protein [Paracoccus sp. IB05]
MPLRGTPWRGAAVLAFFESLLPDSDRIRRLVAERLGARGTDACGLLSVIGRDCVGALQVIAGEGVPPGSTGQPLSLCPR